MSFQKTLKFYSLIIIFVGCKTVDRNVDKIEEGYFLYEVNIPGNFHTEGDAIVQSNLYVKIKSKNIDKNAIKNAYLNGVYDLFENYYPYSDEENSKSLGDFLEESNKWIYDYYRNPNDKKYLKIGKLVFVIFKGSFVIEKKDRQKWLIPKIEQSISSFLNEEIELDTYIVKKVKSYKFVYPNEM